MATVFIRNVDEETKRKLRIRAATNGRSMEAEARRILEDGLARQVILEPEEFEKRLKAVRGSWKGGMTTDEVMEMTRGE